MSASASLFGHLRRSVTSSRLRRLEPRALEAVYLVECFSGGTPTLLSPHSSPYLHQYGSLLSLRRCMDTLSREPVRTTRGVGDVAVNTGRVTRRCWHSAVELG